MITQGLQRRAIAVTAVLAMLFALAPIGEPDASAAPATFSKAFSPDTIAPGGVSTLTFTITNGTEVVPSEALAFTDVLPAAVAIATPANVSDTCFGTVTAPDGGTTIELTAGRVGAGDTCTVAVDVTATTPGTHTNTSGDLTSTAGNSGTAVDDLTVVVDRPAFSKSFSPSVVGFGGRSTLTFTLDNTANGSMVTSASFEDPLPIGMIVADPPNIANACGVGDLVAIAGSDMITYAAFNVLPSVVAAGASCTISVDVAANSLGTLSNSTGELLSSGGGTSVSSGLATAVLQVNPVSLQLVKEFADDPIVPGGTGTLKFTVFNPSRLDGVGAIGFSDDLGAMLSGAVALAPLPAEPCGVGSTLSGSGVVVLSGGTLPVEGSCTFDVTFAVPAGAAAGSYPNTTDEVTGSIGNATVTGNAASDVLFVAAAPVLTKEFTDDPVGAGGSVTLNFTITDTTQAGGSSDISFTDELTTFLPFPVSLVLPADGFCGAGSSLDVVSLGTDRQGLFMAGGSLAAGAGCSFDVTIDLPAGLAANNYINTTGAITATVAGATVIGDSTTDTLLLVASPSLHKDFIEDSIIPGATTTLEFTISNGNFLPEESDLDAVGPATDITFTDDLSFLPGLTATGLPLTAVCGTGSSLTGSAGDTLLTFAAGSLDPFETCSFSVTLQSSPTAPQGVHTNTTSAVTANVLGAVVSDPAAADDLVVAALALTKEFTDDPVLPGGTVTLEFTLDNTVGTIDATAITFLDDLGNTLTGLLPSAGQLPLTNPCGTGSSLTLISGDTLLFEGGAVPSGSSCTFGLTLAVPAGVLYDDYSNAISFLAATIGGVETFLPGAADDLVVVAPLEIGLTKEFTDDPAVPGGTTTLEFTIFNPSSSVAIASIGFTDDLALTMPGLTATGLPLSDVCGTGSSLSASAGDTFLTFAGGSLAPDAVCTFSVSVLVPGSATPGTYTNTTSSISGDASGAVTGPAASDQLDIIAAPERMADLSITKDDVDDSVAAGATLTYEVTVSNAGPDDAEAVVVFDTLPAGVTLVSTTGCLEDPAGAPSCTLDVVVAGGSKSYLIEVLVDPGFAGTLITNDASVVSTTPDPDPTNNTASEDTDVFVEADLSITKDDDPDPVNAGDTLSYTISVHNAGPSDATDVVVTDTLPAGVTFVATAGCAEDPAGVPTCSLGGIAAGDSAVYTIEVTVDATTSGTITNSAAVTAGSADPDPSNNDATEDTEVVAAEPEADLSITKSATHYWVRAGSTLVYKVVVTNNGPADATDVRVIDFLPEGVSFLSTSGCVEDRAGVPECSLGTIAAGESARHLVRVKVHRDTVGGITNTVLVYSEALDPDPSNNLATADTFVFGRRGHGHRNRHGHRPHRYFSGSHLHWR